MKFPNISNKALFFIDTYADQLKSHIKKYGFCGEFIETDFKPEINKTRLLCQTRSLFFLLDYAKIKNDSSYIKKAYDLYEVIQKNYFCENTKVWSQYPINVSKTNTLYEYAFVLLSFSKLYEVMPSEHLKLAIERVHQILKKEYLTFDIEFSNLKEDGKLCQNSLMHLFEAYLEAYKVFKTDEYLKVVEKLLTVLFNLFYCQKNDLISEYAPIDPNNGIYEPGHSFEWACLVYEAENLNIQLSEFANHQVIAQSAENKGVITKNNKNLVVGSLKGNGESDQSRFRIWPFFERLRYYAMTGNKDKLNNIFPEFTDLYFNENNFPIEYLDQNFKTDFDHIKATTSYHLINCFKFLL